MFEVGQKVRVVAFNGPINHSDRCKVGDVGVYRKYDPDELYGYFHEVKFPRGIEDFREGELEAVEEG